MTGETILFVVVALVLLWLVLRLLREPRPDAAPPPAPAERRQIEELFPLHCRHFPQMRQVLMREDDAWLRRRATGPIYARWRAERRRVAEQFLQTVEKEVLNA